MIRRRNQMITIVQQKSCCLGLLYRMTFKVCDELQENERGQRFLRRGHHPIYDDLVDFCVLQLLKIQNQLSLVKWFNSSHPINIKLKSLRCAHFSTITSDSNPISFEAIPPLNYYTHPFQVNPTPQHLGHTNYYYHQIQSNSSH